MKHSTHRSKIVGLAVGLAGFSLVGLIGLGGISVAAPMTGPEFDKIMILSETGDGPGISVGQFAGCAGDRIQALVNAGERPRSTPKVSGELTEDVFLVTVPGETTDILFYFVGLEGHPGALFLDVITIGGAQATTYADKVNAMSILTPNCL
jgi:hypothetical protein